MTGGGLLTLVAYGQQNILLSGNPQFTYFYKAFRRYSHFSMENVTTVLQGPSELNYDKPITLRAKIERIGDLLSDMYFSFRIPDIYSKFITPTGIGYNSQYEFQWTRYIGAAIINKVVFSVGGTSIQEFDGTYIMARARIDYESDKLKKWEALVGNTPELTDPTNGLYAGGKLNQGYPHVLNNGTTGVAQVNRPSIFGRDIHVPLPLWFCESTNQSLPLVGLQYHECEIQIILNPIQQLYTVLDASGFRVAPGFAVSASSSAISRNIPDYINVSDASTQLKNFLVDWGYTLPNFNNWSLNPRIQSTYTYLTDEDRRVFATAPLSYLYHEVRTFPFLGLYNRQVLDVECHNPVTRLLFVTRRSDSTYRNDFGNLTNWYSYPNPPFSPTPGSTLYFQNSFSSGLLIPQGQVETLRAIRVLADGNEVQQEKPVDYFTRLVPYRYLSGGTENSIPVYSFSLHSPSQQPCGSINSSRIRNFQVEVDVYPLPANTTYTYNLYLYVETINFFEVAAGMGGKKYAT